MIYFIRGKESGKIKIGYSIHPGQRKRDLQTAHYEPLEVIGLLHGPPSLEAELHERFGRYRIRGEWFKPGERLLAFIEENARLKSEVRKIEGTEDEFQILFPEPLKSPMKFYLNIGSFNLRMLADKDCQFVFGIEGRRDVILAWMEWWKDNYDEVEDGAVEGFAAVMDEQLGKTTSEI